MKPNLSLHFITLNSRGVVEAIRDVSRSDIRINGGYFVFRKEIFKYMNEGEELLHEPFQRLVEQGQLLAYKYDGFWAAMDTFKDKQTLDEIHRAVRHLGKFGTAWYLRAWPSLHLLPPRMRLTAKWLLVDN